MNKELVFKEVCMFCKEHTYINTMNICANKNNVLANRNSMKCIKSGYASCEHFTISSFYEKYLKNN